MVSLVYKLSAQPGVFRSYPLDSHCALFRCPIISNAAVHHCLHTDRPCQIFHSSPEKSECANKWIQYFCWCAGWVVCVRVVNCI